MGPPTVIRPRPDPPLPGIPAGPPPVLPVGALPAADINIANMQLNYHKVAVNRDNAANLLCAKHSALGNHAIRQKGRAILIRNRVNLLDRIGIPMNQVLANL